MYTGYPVCENGSPSPLTCNLSQIHDFIEFAVDEFSALAASFRRLYQQGYSIREISKITGRSFSTIQSQLKKDGVTLRINKAVKILHPLRQQFKSSSPPPYGYCYMNGRIEKDPREFQILTIIKEQWQLGNTPTQIAKYLCSRKLKTRKGVAWGQAHVFNIVQRLKEEFKTTKKE